MDSIKKIYTIGYGPSSSHTMGPRKAAEQYKARHPEAAGFRVTLYGSLAATGKGHFTDKAILSVLEPVPTEILWKPETVLPFHTNGMLYEALDKDGNSIDPWTVYSIGGGALSDGKSREDEREVYRRTTLTSILEHIEKQGETYWEYVQQHEEADLWDYR